MIEARPDLAVLAHDFTATGVVRNAVRIAGHCAARGLATEIWVVRNEGQFKAEVPDGVEVRELAASGAAPASGLKRRLQTFRAIPRLAQDIRERAPRTLLSAGNHFHLSAGLAYARAGRPHSTRLLCRASNAAPRQGGPLADWLDGRKYREMHRIIAVSNELARDLERRLGVPKERIRVIPNGVDLAQVQRLAQCPLDDPWLAPGQPPVIVAAGRLSPQKNYPLLLDAFARLRRTRPARLVVLGEGTQAARRALLDRARRHGVADDVRLPGFEANPLRFFARAGLFVLSSRWEGASNVLLEALACGCPVVAVDCPTGVREQLDDGRIGPIVPQGDADGLARAMASRLDAPRSAEALRSHAARFDQKTMLDGYGRLIEDEIGLARP